MNLKIMRDTDPAIGQASGGTPQSTIDDNTFTLKLDKAKLTAEEQNLLKLFGKGDKLTSDEKVIYDKLMSTIEPQKPEPTKDSSKDKEEPENSTEVFRKAYSKAREKERKDLAKLLGVEPDKLSPEYLEKLAKQASEWKKYQDTTKTEDQKKFEALQEQLEEHVQKIAGYEDRLKQEQGKIDSLMNFVKHVGIKDTLMKEANTYKAINPEILATHIKESYGLDIDGEKLLENISEGKFEIPIIDRTKKQVDLKTVFETIVKKPEFAFMFNSLPVKSGSGGNNQGNPNIKATKSDTEMLKEALIQEKAKIMDVREVK